MLKTNTLKKDIPKEILSGVKIAIVRSEFNGEITEKLEKACFGVLVGMGVTQRQIKTWLVPGALEIPIMAGLIAQKKKANVIIALGAVIRGETHHFDIVANESARGCMDVSLKYMVPVINGIICVFSEKQAKERAGDNNMNKGKEAAVAAMKMFEEIFKFKNENNYGKSR